jgi:hypothetical protein
MSPTSVTKPGWNLLDAVAIVTGAAVASVHVRERIDPGGHLTTIGGGLLVASFLFLSLTSTGPILYFVRKFLRHTHRYPRDGDRVWMMLGLPWFVVALWRSSLGPVPSRLALERTAGMLQVGIGLAAVYSTWMLIKRWRELAPPPNGEPDPPRVTPASSRIGFALGAAWPLQLGLALTLYP